MNIIIIGSGRIATELAEQLNEKGNFITVIDDDADAVNELSSRLDIMGVVGNGATHAMQERAGLSRADLLIAVGESDEFNLLCCINARKSTKCTTIARIRNPEYRRDAPYLKENLGLAMVINPEQAAAEEIARVLRFPGAISVDTFAKGRVELIKFRLPDGCPLIGKCVKDSVLPDGVSALFCTAERGNEAFIIKGDFVFQKDDIVSIIAGPESLYAFFKGIGYDQHSMRDVMIIGGGETAEYLCDILYSHKINVKIIERDKARCEELAANRRNITVVCGDTNDRHLLEEEGFGTVSGIAVVTSHDEENILLSMLAERTTHAKIVTRINRADYRQVLDGLGLDSFIFPQKIAAEQIIRFVRATGNSNGSSMERLYHLIEGKVEAAEFTVGKKSSLTDTPLSKLSFKKDTLIAAVIHNNQVIIPRGDTRIAVGDSVVVVTSQESLHALDDILK